MLLPIPGRLGEGLQTWQLDRQLGTKHVYLGAHLANHSLAWETLALYWLFPTLTWLCVLAGKMIDSWVWYHYHRLRSQLSCLRNFLCVLQQSSSEENLIKGKSKKLSNTKRMILRNKIAQFLLHLTATLSKVMELCPLRQFIKLKHLPLCILGMSLTMPRLKPPLFQRTVQNILTLLKVKKLLRQHPQLPNPTLKMVMQLLKVKTKLQFLFQPNVFRNLSQ